MSRMEVRCPRNHGENISFEELASRLSENDFECREDGCEKKVTYGVDHRFWERYDGHVRGPGPRGDV